MGCGASLHAPSVAKYEKPESVTTDASSECLSESQPDSVREPRRSLSDELRAEAAASKLAGADVTGGRSARMACAASTGTLVDTSMLAPGSGGASRRASGIRPRRSSAACGRSEEEDMLRGRRASRLSQRRGSAGLDQHSIQEMMVASAQKDGGLSSAAKLNQLLAQQAAASPQPVQPAQPHSEHSQGQQR